MRPILPELDVPMTGLDRNSRRSPLLSFGAVELSASLRFVSSALHLARCNQATALVTRNDCEGGQLDNDSRGQARNKLSPTNGRDAKVVPFGERLSCTVDEACAASGLGRTKLYELIGSGQLVTTTVGRRRLVIVRSLLALLDATNSV